MPLPWNRNRISPDFIAAPAEARPVPLMHHLIDEAEIIELDERVYAYRRAGQMTMADRLLDQRNAIRPARPADVPVIPGRSA